MALDVVLVVVALSNVALHSIAALFVVGRDRLRLLGRSPIERLRARSGPLALLAGVLVLNDLIRDLVVEVSWIVGWNVTGALYAAEGDLVAQLQSLASPMLTGYFSFVYVVGYVFLLTFPLLAYLALSDPRPLRRTAVAYSVNYLVGLLCYLLFVAYGPRNLMPDAVSSLLYHSYPGIHLLTTQVNSSTNVFPSLHTSLSVTVAILAWRTRGTYPRWAPVAAALAASIALSTMYLGIHWATDVLAGATLAVVSVVVADRIEGLPDSADGEADDTDDPDRGRPEPAD